DRRWKRSRSPQPLRARHCRPVPWAHAPRSSAYIRTSPSTPPFRGEMRERCARSEPAIGSARVGSASTDADGSQFGGAQFADQLAAITLAGVLVRPPPEEARTVAKPAVGDLV